jgi:transcriptional regulator with XRE-family HTH domain
MKTTAQRTGDNVRAEMARHGLSQAALAEQLGMSQSMLSARLAGKVPFNVDELAAVATALAVPSSTLLADQPAAT